MLPDFGVGLRTLLFEPMNGRTYDRISSRILSQVKKYLPFVSVESIKMNTAEANPTLGDNEVSVSIKYNVGSIDTSDTLTISQTND